MPRIRLSIEQVEDIVERGVEEIAITAASLADAAPRAGRFLVRVAVLTDFLRDVEDDSPRHQTAVNMTYNQAIYNAGGKNITEKKVEAEANAEYNKALEDQGKHESMRTWVKNHIKNFDNAHILYRQHSNVRNA
jgi:hypothetical protein